MTLTCSIESVVIQDPADELETSAGSLILGVGLRESTTVQQAVAQLGNRSAAGLVVRAPFEADQGLAAAAEAAGVPVLSLAQGASWGHLASTLRALMTPHDPDGTRPSEFGGILAGDLFAVANAVAALLEAPVTIEDRHSRLLAFSSMQEGADASRVQTILGRQVPEHYTRFLEEQGVFQDIFRSDRPVFVAPLPVEAGAQPEEQARAAIAVRAGDEILGTIWVAAREPLNAKHEQTLLESARLVAMHMVWQRADADVERRLRAKLLGAAFEGGSAGREAVQKLELRDEPSVVLALTLLVPGNARFTPAHVAAERRRIADAFAVHLSFAHPRTVSGLIADVAYAVLPLSATHTDEDAVRLAEEFLSRVRSPLQPLIGIGRPASGPDELSDSRSRADRALRVLSSPASKRTIARFDEVHADALLLELPVPATDFPSGAIARLSAYDEEHQSALIDTLRAWFDAFGDVTVAAAAVHVHTNTFRYRLKRVGEVGELDLADPDARFAAMLQLKLLTLAANF